MKDVSAIAADHEYSLALRKNGTVVAWGQGLSHQTDIPEGLAGVIAVAAGDDFCLALTTNIYVPPKK